MDAVNALCHAMIRMDLDRFIKILRVELEHLEHHVELMVEGYRERLRCREVREHVYQENVAVLQNEECGLMRYVAILDSLDPGAYQDLGALIADIRERFKGVVQHADIAAATYIFAERKINKVERYVRDQS